eukprot:m.31532 g.31532  ORF g.31532 m.31532 type:complete len:1880 (-) comp4810_c0_seq1:140-5779(-)
MISSWGMVRLLTWKNFLLQKRRPIGTFFEIFIPLVLILAMLSLRAVILESTKSDTSFCDQHVGVADAGNGTSFCFARQWISPTIMAETDSDCSDQYYTTIAFVPNSSSQVLALMDIVREELDPFFVAAGRNVSYIALAADTDFKTIVKEEELLLFAAIVFENPDQLDSSLSGQTPSYQLRMPSDLPQQTGRNQRWATDRNYPIFEAVGIREYEQIPYTVPTALSYDYRGVNKRVNNGFWFIQAAVDRAITTLLHPTQAKPQATPRLKSYPFPEHTNDNFIFVIQGFFPLILVLSFLFPVMSMTRQLVAEKESRMREAMRMMGLPTWVNWLSWFIKDIIMLLITIILIVIVFNAGKLVNNSAVFTIFIFLLFFVFAIIAYSYMMSTFFSQANVAGITSLLFFFLLYQPFSSVGDNGVYETMSHSEKAAMCLAFPSCMGVGARILAQFESRGIGLQLSNLNENPSDGETFSMDDVLGFLMLDALIMWGIAWYVDKIFPGQYGIPLHPLFFLDRHYWRGQATAARHDATNTNPIAEPHRRKMSERFVDDFEQVDTWPEGVGIDVTDLTKEFPVHGGMKRVVDRVTMQIPVGVLTVLLGPNGAGKSTCLNMMTGLLNPTAGTVIVNGHDMVTDTQNARESIGYCPQFDILWDALTVAEHLYFYMRLRGISDESKIATETDELLEDINLQNKKNELSKTLSGGQKRALSVSLAMAGSTKLVVLDEPTSGMDPQKRRRTWDMVLKRKHGRTIILTTHHMDEADVLGERIVIMKDGELRCAGTPLFLKDRFGCGYRLVASKGPACDDNAITELVQRHVPEATLDSNYGAEITFALPKQSSPSFGALFNELESRQEELSIESCGASMTTLENVFLKISHGTFDNEAAHVEKEHDDTDDSVLINKMNDTNNVEAGTPSKHPTPSGWKQLVNQCRAMWYKRSRHYLQHKKTVFAQIVVPSFFMFLALLIATTVEDPVEDVEPCRTFDTGSYESNPIYISDDNTGYDTQNADTEYYNTATVMGSLGPNARQTAFSSVATSLASTASLYTNSQPLDIAGENMTTVLLQDAEGFEKSEFYRKNVLSSSFIPGGIWLDDNCAVRDGTTYTAVASVNIVAGGAHVFQRVAADFGYAPASETFSLDCPTACNSTGGTSKLFCDYNVNNTATAPSFSIPWEQQCGDNPHVQWVEIKPTVADIGQTYTVTCTAGSTLTVNVVSATDPTRYNTSAVVALAWYNRQAYHAGPESLNFADNAIARDHLSDNNVLITTANCPLPKSNEDLAADQEDNNIALSLGINVALTLSFLVGSFVLFPVNERNQHAKHIQLVSGLDVRTYWFTALVWDFCISIVPFVIFLILFAAFQLKEFEGDNLGIVFFILLLFGWAAIPMVYCMTFMYKSSATAYTLTVVLLFIITLVMVIVTFILPLLNDGRYRKNGVLDDCINAFMINPAYAATQGIINTYQNYRFLDFCNGRESFCNEFGYEPQSDYFSLDGLGVGVSCLALFIEGIFFIMLLLFLEWLDTRGRRAGAQQVDATIPDEDEDVWEERSRVSEGHAKDEAVVVENLTKLFGTKAAVNKVTFGIPHGECFGLLGVNGAGKTTLFRMLTGEIGMSFGGAAVNGSDVARDLVNARRHIGYTPQYDGLIPHLTGRDHLVMFGLLRGIPDEHLHREVNHTIAMLDLDKHADNLAGTYSGGNKRKLSTAIALIGRPEVVFLDEPTSGVDPAARRKLWNTIIKTVRDGTTVVLTTHSMEEVEALCSRLTIMVAGELKCLGSLQHLKGRFGTGVYVSVKMKSDSNVSEVLRAIRDKASATQPEDTKLQIDVLAQYSSTVSLWVKEGASLGDLFTWMESDTVKALVSDYGVNQPSLEQVFLGFARQAEADSARVSAARISGI